MFIMKHYTSTWLFGVSWDTLLYCLIGILCVPFLKVSMQTLEMELVVFIFSQKQKLIKFEMFIMQRNTYNGSFVLDDIRCASIK